MEHVEATRAAIRKVLRSNGLGSSTRVVEGVVHVWSDDAYQALDPAQIKGGEQQQQHHGQNQCQFDEALASGVAAVVASRS